MTSETPETQAAGREAIADLARRRVEYGSDHLDEVAADPHTQFRTWFAKAEDAVTEPNAMLLATADDSGPAARIVLLKGFDAAGFTFFTNYDSAKGRQIAAQPIVALTFPWLELQRQVRVRGIAEQLPAADSDAYFAMRPRGAQIGAVASRQSAPVASREEMQQAYDAAAADCEGTEVTRPRNWGGYRVRAFEIEFWQGRAHRFHDRFVYMSTDGQPADLATAADWSITRLNP
ncbi:pyridoxamine 5'-phosphate oxidase [Brevibacterium sp. p3-SID960]|uniref:pyridoxamine 5'-phosphate oxidase n=1 Tax=Brevibacterium sp. p3-SID960 TaxID=2916063 RepID=UPI0021A88596|nr:pyridoxamine 5'-phosphate oxidase [Brevibacterium sp. p3-SID960]MCT1690475.1 pyridoxamine 5'-phosphate oxidase [Brevibacterium sp. p3-SID960]